LNFSGTGIRKHSVSGSLPVCFHYYNFFQKQDRTSFLMSEVPSGLVRSFSPIGETQGANGAAGLFGHSLLAAPFFGQSRKGMAAEPACVARSTRDQYEINDDHQVSRIFMDAIFRSVRDRSGGSKTSENPGKSAPDGKLMVSAKRCSGPCVGARPGLEQTDFSCVAANVVSDAHAPRARNSRYRTAAAVSR
jgi:hypothetical protein